MRPLRSWKSSGRKRKRTLRHHLPQAFSNRRPTGNSVSQQKRPCPLPKAFMKGWNLAIGARQGLSPIWERIRSGYQVKPFQRPGNSSPRLLASITSRKDPRHTVVPRELKRPMRPSGPHQSSLGLMISPHFWQKSNLLSIPWSGKDSWLARWIRPSWSRRRLTLLQDERPLELQGLSSLSRDSPLCMRKVVKRTQSRTKTKRQFSHL